MTEATFDTIADTAIKERDYFIRKPEAMRRTGFLERQFDREVEAGNVPKGIKTTEGGQVVVWSSNEIDAWLDAKKAGR